MIFTCATLLRLLGGKKNLLDHAGMFSFKLMVKKEREKGGGDESVAFRAVET